MRTDFIIICYICVDSHDHLYYLPNVQKEITFLPTTDLEENINPIHHGIKEKRKKKTHE